MTAVRATLAISFFFLSACSQLGSSYIKIRNDGDAPLTAVDVQLGGKRYQVELIRSKAVAKITFEPVSDSAVRIEYVSQGRKRTCVGDVYVTTGLRTRISAVIGTGDACKVEEMD